MHSFHEQFFDTEKQDRQCR